MTQERFIEKNIGQAESSNWFNTRFSIKCL